MGVPYRETYETLGRIYGIEDHEDGQTGHFFTESRRGRFQLWSGGCGIGYADTIEEARKLLHTSICIYLAAERRSAQRALYAAHAALLKIEGDVFYLGRIMK